ncbi:MAG: septum formation protein Maf [Clostridia bacterium]|nr:septum formation protein Maf [Clostridia bacterium]
MKIILASKSPRRKEILETLGFEFSIVTAETDESSTETNPCALTRELARRKGSDVVKLINDSDVLVISCDTIVWCDGKILGKPKTQEDAKEMLRFLSGKKHTVTSGLSLSLNGKTVTDSEDTDVYFAKLSESFIEKYVESGEPMDKAGSYAVQGTASMWIEKIDGCYFNVVGLPVRLLCKLLQELNLDPGTLAMKI